MVNNLNNDNLAIDNSNLDIASKFFYFLLFVSFVLQMTMSNNLNDIFVIFLITISNILTTYYCFNKRYFFEYPISLFVVFISNFCCFGAVIFLKTFELTLVTGDLHYPVGTMVFLFTASLVVITAHYIYMKSNTLNKIKVSLSNFFSRINLFKVETNNFLYFLGVIGIVSHVFFYDLNVELIALNIMSQKKAVIDWQDSSSLFQDVLRWLQFLKYAPLLTLFSSQLYKTPGIDKKNWLLIIFILFVVIISFSRNKRSDSFDYIASIGFIYIFLFLLGLMKQGRFFFAKLITIIVLVVPVVNIANYTSDILLMQRIEMKQYTILENIGRTFSTFFFPSKRSDSKKYLEDTLAMYSARALRTETGEDYYKNNFFTRFCPVPRADFFYMVNENLDTIQRKQIRADVIPRIIAVVPQPIINLFTKNFNKRDIGRFSPGSLVLNTFDYRHGLGSNSFSMLIQLKILFGSLWFLPLFALCLLTFVVFDSFHNKKLMLISPIIFLYFFRNGNGVINSFATGSLDQNISFLIRELPQGIILYLILRSIYFYVVPKFSTARK